MDDLLSVALSEAGLEEFLTAAPPTSESPATSTHETSTGTEVAPSPSTSSFSVEATPTTSTLPSTNKSREQNEVTPPAEDLPGASTSSDNHVEMSLPSTSTVSPVAERTGIGVVRNSSANVAPRLATVPLKPGSSPSAQKQIRQVYTASPTGGQLFRQVVHTPDGPRTQLLRPFINEHGQTVYRAVRTISTTRAADGRNRSLVVRNVNGSPGIVSNYEHQNSSTDPVKEPQRIVVIRQNTPSGPVLIRKPIPAGMPIAQALSAATNGGLVRKFVPRGTRLPGTKQRNSRSIIPRAHQSSASRSAVRKFRQQYYGLESSCRLVRQFHSRHAEGASRGREALNEGKEFAEFLFRGGFFSISRMTGVECAHFCLSGYSVRPAAAYSTSRSNASSWSGNKTGAPSYVEFSEPGGNTSGQPNFREPDAVFEHHNASSQKLTQQYSTSSRPAGVRPGEVVRRPHPALVHSSSATLQQHKATRGVPVVGAAVASSVGAFEHLDVTKMLSSSTPVPTNRPPLNSSVPVPNAQPSKPYSKSQKAKDEMKLAHQSATEKRSEIDEDEENLGYAETYADYVPAKLRSGVAHPDSVVETASLSSVAPPDVKYQISIPEYLIDNGSISALQLEAVIYACQMHQQRLPSGERIGYLIGDGAGVGKGRTVAAIIFENYLLGRKRSIWLSVSSDLKYDAERDLRDIGAGNIM
ncbi:hypothetical protein COOONC_03840 [Cooperia oncophora]